MKRLLIALALLASFGASASEEYTYHCVDMNGNAATFINGEAGNVEYVDYGSLRYTHTGTSEDDASIFTSDPNHRLYLHWVNNGLTVINVFSPVRPMINEFECSTPE